MRGFLSCILINRFIFIEWHDERREVESKTVFQVSSHTHSRFLTLHHFFLLHGFINIRLFFGFAPAMEISRTLNSVAPITSASTRFSISIITGSAYNLGRVQVSHQTFQALALSVNSRPGRSGNEIGRVGIPIDHSPTDSWERVFGNLAEMTWELQTIENGHIRWCLIFTLDCERGWVDLLLFFCCWDSCWEDYTSCLLYWA